MIQWFGDHDGIIRFFWSPPACSVCWNGHFLPSLHLHLLIKRALRRMPLATGTRWLAFFLPFRGSFTQRSILLESRTVTNPLLWKRGFLRIWFKSTLVSSRALTSCAKSELFQGVVNEKRNASYEFLFQKPDQPSCPVWCVEIHTPEQYLGCTAVAMASAVLTVQS